MRYAQIRAFHYVALHNGFSRAAQVLYLTQPAISDQVKKLEKEYDILLFNRQKKQITLTKKGQKLFKITQRFFEVENQMRNFLLENKKLTVGTLLVKVDNVYHILTTVKQFCVKFPQVNIKIKTGNSQDVMQDVLSHNADIGILADMPKHPNIESITLSKSPIIAYSAITSPFSKYKSLSFQQLKKLPLIMRESASATRQKLEAAAATCHIALNPTIEAQGREAVQEIIRTGAGIGFISQKEFSNNGIFVPIIITNCNIETKETAINLKERKNNKLIRAFMMMIKNDFTNKKLSKSSI